VLFSGMGTPEEVAAQISVGVGALAGSTIMLLTIPWALCIITGRVDIVNGSAYYKGKPPRLTEPNKWSLTGSGITPRKSISFNAKIMIATAVSYVIIQGAAFYAKCDEEKKETECSVKGEHWWALVALLTSIGFFIGYLVYNIKTADNEDNEDLIDEVKKHAVESHIISFSAAFEPHLHAGGAQIHLLNKDEQKKRFDDALKSFFHKYDRNGDGVIDPYELKFLLKDIGEDMDEEKFQVLLKEIDTDGSGSISFPEFTEAMRKWVHKKNEASGDTSVVSLSVQHTELSPLAHAEEHLAEKVEEQEEEEDDEEEEEVPEDLASLPPHKQKLRILLRSGWMMGVGTVIVLLFSDPMVDVLNALGNRAKINPFYVAFVLAPVASNASELIASIAYASKKTKKTITISLAALEGAACMNNTFCLGIFLALIFVKEIPWAFSAETISIIFVEAALFGFAQIQTHKLYYAGAILSLYPISIFLVWFLEQVAGLN